MIIEVFNKYNEFGGEEKIADQIFLELSHRYKVERLQINSSEWHGSDAPNKYKQLNKVFYNQGSYDQFRESVMSNTAEVALFHNIYPVGSPSLYKAAIDANIPVIQYIHNFRPFSVSGTLWNGKRVTAESLTGNYFSEVMSGSWQGSVVKSAIFALLLKKLHAQGWLDAVKHWIAISDFMRDRFIEAGIAPEKITTLRHSWDMMKSLPETRDEGYYLFLGRLTTEKGIHQLLETWISLERELGDKCPQLIIGGVGSEQQAVEQASKICSKIDYVGFVDGDKKSELITNCRAMLAPSVWWEPLGLVTYEAYDYGKPMIAASSGGLTETVIHEQTGYLYEPLDIIHFTSTIKMCESLTALERMQMGLAGRKWLQENASVEKWSDSFNEILTKLAL